MNYPWAVPGAKVTPIEGEWRGDERVDRPVKGQVYTISDVRPDVEGVVCLLLVELNSCFEDAHYGYPAHGFRPVISKDQDIAMFRAIAARGLAQNGIQVSSPHEERV